MSETLQNFGSQSNFLNTFMIVMADVQFINKVNNMVLPKLGRVHG